MVVLAVVLRNASKPPSTRNKRRFLDSMRLLVKGGAGGHGFPKFGGIGGPGGDVYVEGQSDASLKTIVQKNPTKRIVAGNGEDSSKARILGAKGADITLRVPLGVTLYNELGQTVGDIDQEGEKVLVAKGGEGGRKETGFSGLKGQKYVLTMDLKLIADIGLVGFPNAGKSTLLSILSNAKPKIASYPFTTIQPNLGVLAYPDLRQITMADLPGLIEGAHANIGMGHKFLKHVERTKLLLVVVDVTGFQLGHKYKKRSGLETLILLNKELELYKEELLDKPAVFVINKIDLPDTEKLADEIHEAAQNLSAVLHTVPEHLRPNRTLNFSRILRMSAKSNNPEEVETLKSLLREVVDETALLNNEEDVEFFKKMDKEYRKRGPLLI